MIDAIPGMIFLIAISIIGVICAKVIPVKIPAVAYVVTIGCIVTIPGFPGATIFNAWAQKVTFGSHYTNSSLCRYLIGRDLPC